MEKDVTILGAGVVGICTALSLAERGVAARLIDRGDPGQETSFGNAGVISPWSIIPQALPGTWKQMPHLLFGKYRPLAVRTTFWPRMARWGLAFLSNGTEARVQRAADAMEVLCGPSIDLYRRHLQGTGAEGLVRDSCYIHAFREGDKASLRSLDYRIRQEKGARLELVGVDELRRIEPALSHDFKAAVLIHDQARALSPGRIGAALADKARSLGVEIVKEQVTGLMRTDLGWRISCNAGVYEASRVVIAMGAWSPEILRPLGINVPLVAERGYHLEFSAPGIEVNNSVMDTDAKIVASSMEGDVNDPPDPRKQPRMLAQAKAAFPDLATDRPSFWMGRRPTFPDSLPMIGEFDDQPGLFAGFGHSHWGLMMAPKTGELLADILSGRSNNIDCSAYSTGRFSRGLIPTTDL